MTWDRELLLQIGDKKISRESLIAELAVSTLRYRRLTALFRNDFRDTKLIELFGQVISRLPEDIFFRLVEIPNLFFNYFEGYGRVNTISS